MAKTKKKRLMTSILDGNANYYLGGGDTNSYYTQQMVTDNDGMRRMQFMPSESTMTNPFGQESAYNGTYKMNRLPYNDYDYQNMTPEAQQQFDAYNQQVKDNNQQYRQNKREAKQEAKQQEGGGFGMWGNVINGAANNLITAFTDPNMKVGDRVATILGMPSLAKNWRADTTKGDANISEMTNRINNATNNRLIQDSNDTQGAFAAIKNNNNLNLIDTSGFKTPTLKDFKGNWWKNTGVAMAQGAASGSIGGPWGAAGGAVTGLLGSIGGLFGRKGRAERALDKYKDDMSYLQRFAGNFNSLQHLNQQQSNENLLSNGLKQQRIQDLSNIRAFGGNLFALGDYMKPSIDPSIDPTNPAEESPLGLERMEYSDPKFMPQELQYQKVDPTNSMWQTNPEFMQRAQDAINYNINRYNQRKDIGQKNINELVSAGYTKYLGNGDLVPFIEKSVNPDGSISYQKNLNKSKLRTINNNTKLIGDFNDVFDTWANNMSNARWFDNSQIPLRSEKTGGEYKPVDSGEYSHSIIVNPTLQKEFDEAHKDINSNRYNTSNEHEGSHSRDADSFYNVLFKIHKLQQYNLTPEQQNKVKSYGEGSYPGYYTTPDEVIARREEVVKTLGLDPRDKVTKEFLNKPEVRQQLKNYKLDFYNDDQLVDLFNNIVDNNNSKQYDNVAAYGGNLFDDGGDLGDDYVYEGGILPEVSIIEEAMPWYEKWYNKGKRALGRGWENVKNIMSTPTMTALPSQSPTFQGQFFPTMPSTVGDDLEYALSIASAPWDIEGIGQAAWVLKHPKEAAKLLKQPVDKLVDWAKRKTSKEASNKLINEINGVSNNVLNMPSNGNYIPSKNYFYSQIDNPSTAKYIAEVEGNPAFQTRPFSKFYPEDETLSYLRHNSLGRTRKYGTDSFSPKQIDEFDKAFNNYMKDYDYQTFNSQKWEKAGKKDLAGFHDPENKYIAIVEDYKIPPKDIKRHEVRHAYDNYGDILSNKQHDILNNAYGSDFVDLPKNLDETDPLKGYSNMFLEKTTTNLDARKALLKGREETASIDVQNMIIDKMTDEKIIEAVRNSNGYGKRYIKYLEENNLLTPQKVQAFRDAMKYVGAGAGIELINNNIKAMGGNLYTDLSPNMMNLWNGKQNIDKQKLMNQQMNFSLGNSFNQKLNTFDYGGSMSMKDLPDNMQSYGNGGTHEENPNGGIQVGVDQQGTPNLVEQGEFRYGDYVFSDRINVDPELLTEFNLTPASKGKKKKNESYADAAKKMVKKAGDLNDPITKDTIDANMDRLKNAQEAQKFKEQQDRQLADYKSALKTPTQGNPMYGSMKYNGMGDVNQGLNEGVDSGMGAMDNSSLSNVNRSGNEMMAAYGGNLYPDGGNIIISNTGVEFRKQPNGTWMSANGDTWSDEEMQQFVDNGEVTMRPISTNPAIAVANDIVNRMNTPSYGGSNSFETTPLYATPYFQLNPLGGLAGSGLATDTPLRDLGMQKTYPIIGNGEETGDVYMTPTGIRTSEQILNQPKNTDYTPLTWNSQASNTMNPLYNIDVNLGFGQTQNGALGNGNIYNQQFGLGIRPDYVASKNPNKTVEAVSTYGKNVNGQIQYDPNGNPVMLYPNTYKGLNGKGQTFNSTFGDPVADVYTNPVNVDNKGFYKFGNTQSATNTSTNTGGTPSSQSYGHSFSVDKTTTRLAKDDVVDNNINVSKDATASGTTQNPQQSVSSLGDLQRLNAQYATGNPFDAPSYSTFGRHAAPLKFLPAAFADRMGLTNFDYDPNLRPNQELKAAGRTGFVPRTDDHSGMYRNAELFDINAANNAAQAQAAATARAMRNVNDRNQGAANQLAADYNAMLGIGNNYQTMFDANMKSRLATDEYNKQTEQTNVQANNDMYRDNQNAGIQAKQMELNTLAQSMADQTQKELYADKTNREAHDNIAGTQTALWNNTMQHLMDEAKRNDLYNKFNSDASQMWYYDKKLGKYVFKGDPAQAYLGTAMRTAKNPVTSLDADLLKQYNDYVAKVGSQNVSREFIDNLVYQQGQRNKENEAKSIADRNAQMQSDIDFMNTQFSDLDNLTITDKDKSYKFFDYINSPKQVEAVRNFLANADVSQMNPNDYKNYKALLDNWMRMRDRQLMYRNQISPYNVADATNTTWVGQDNQAYGGYINSSKKKKKQYYTDI